MLSAADLAQAEAMIAEIEASGGAPNDGSMAALTSVPMIIAYVYREAEQQDGAEHAADLAEALVRIIPLPPAEVREIAAVLEAIGFAALSSMLRAVAGRRKSSLTPLA
jgi:hypothetical protein